VSILLPISFVMARWSGEMRNGRQKKEEASQEKGKVFWKRRPSEIRGYQAALYINAENGDYLRVDYNIKDKRVRIYLEDAEEGGNPYYLVIQNGKVTAQRNATTGRAYAVSDKLMKRSKLLVSISNRQIQEIVKSSLGLEETARESDKKKEERRELLDRTRKRYFRPEGSESTDGAGERESASRRFFLDGVDLAAGILVCGLLFLYHHSFILLGISAALVGITFGLVDMFMRGRQPSLMKMLIFILSGLAIYIYGFYFF